MKVRSIEVGKIYVDGNIRKDPDKTIVELAQSLDRIGQIQPIVVQRVGSRYKVVCGVRRFRAMRMNREPFVDCVISEDLTQDEFEMMKFEENVQRENLSPAEIVAFLDKLKERHPGITRKGLSKLIGKSSAWIKGKYDWKYGVDALVDLGLPIEDVKNIPEGHMRRLKVARDPRDKKEIAEKVMAGELSQRDVYEEVKQRNGRAITFKTDDTRWVKGDFSIVVVDDRNVYLTFADRERLKIIVETLKGLGGFVHGDQAEKREVEGS